MLNKEKYMANEPVKPFKDTKQLRQKMLDTCFYLRDVLHYFISTWGNMSARLEGGLLDPGIFLQVDTYWVNTGGGDSVKVIENLGERAPLIHIKDGPCDPGEPMTAVGEGKMEFAPIIDATQGTAEWLIVEIDRCNGSMMSAVERSYSYLTGQGLARGAR